jgi:hypothetical protein
MSRRWFVPWLMFAEYFLLASFVLGAMLLKTT